MNNVRSLTFRDRGADVEVKEYEDGWYVGGLTDRDIRSVGERSVSRFQEKEKRGGNDNNK
jgi:hypothetical protein